VSATGSLTAGRLLFQRDLRLALRRWDQISDPLVFFLMVTTLFPLALGPELSRLKDVAPGVLWVAALLSSLLASDSLLKSDAQDGTLEQYVFIRAAADVAAARQDGGALDLSGLPLVLISPSAVALGAPVTALACRGRAWFRDTGVEPAGRIGAALTIGLRRGPLLALLVMPLAMPCSFRREGNGTRDHCEVCRRAVVSRGRDAGVGADSGATDLCSGCAHQFRVTGDRELCGPGFTNWPRRRTSIASLACWCRGSGGRRWC
jgi:heme exporter protein B